MQKIVLLAAGIGVPHPKRETRRRSRLGWDRMVLNLKLAPIYFPAASTTGGIFRNSSGFSARGVNRASKIAPLK